MSKLMITSRKLILFVDETLGMAISIVETLLRRGNFILVRQFFLCCTVFKRHKTCITVLGKTEWNSGVHILNILD